jgi:hypothetical protein
MRQRADVRLQLVILFWRCSVYKHVYVYFTMYHSAPRTRMGPARTEAR